MAQAMNYSMLAGGKRLRPMLIRETYRLFDAAQEEVAEAVYGRNGDDPYSFADPR